MKARSAARRFCKTFGLLAVGFLLVQQPGAAATLTVTNLNDSGPGSLRDRIAVANAGDTITFSVNGTIDLLSTLTINKRLTISHPTGNLTLRGGSDGSTLIEITGTLVSMFDLSVLGSFDGRGIGLAVRKGASAIVSRCEFTRFRIGVLNDGGLTLLDCTVSLNLSVNSTSCQPLLGAGIVNRATISLSACSIYDNTVRYDLTCADMPDNGGLANTGVADAVNTTFWRNGVHNDAAGTLTLRSCTLSSSSITNASGAVDIGNTILHQSVIMNSLAGNFTSAGYNLSDTGGQGHLTATGDLSNAEPKLGSFNFHGGFTRSFALARGSAAIDRGAAFGISQDQRGQNRPVDFTGYPNATNGTDIGAHEVTETAQSGNLIVTISTDTNDGVCGTIDCSLREAINAANALAGDNTITFDEAITGTLAPASALPAIASNIHLQGPGARLLALSGSAQRRVLVFSSGSSSLSGLTIRNGAQFGTSVSPATGGGLANAAALTVSDCAFIGNFAFGFDAASPGGIGGPGLGGAIANTIGGNLTLERCTFSSNGVDGGLGAANSGAFNSGGAGGAAYGGAIYNDSSSTVALVNCTLAGNSATGGAGGSNTGTNGFGGNGGPGGGGGIFSRGTLSLTSCTFRSNTGAGGAGGQGSGLVRNGVAGPGTGGIENENGSATIRNTIVSLNTGNAGPDVKGAFTSQGYNLIGIGDFASGFNGPADQIGTTAAPIDPKLATLQNNGGPTDTVALLPGSPAQDAGKSFGLTMDQRGMTRPHDHLLVGNASGGDASEIGAFETTGVLFVTTLDDHNDGECDTLDCTLREALSEASSQPGAVIAFKPGLSGIIQLTAPLSTLQTAVSITGPGSNVITVRRNTGGNYRIFTISNGATINISGLTIANGMAPGGGPFPADAGGAILNLFGTLNISRCAFVQNQANFGGAIMNMMTGAENSTVTVGESTFTGNAASDGAGGAIYNYATGSGSTATATLTNCTLSGNTAGAGAALYNYSGQSGGSTVTLLNCTIANNSAEGGSVTNSNFAGSTVIFMRNSLFKTGATGPNFFNDAATFTSLGNNLSNDTAGGPAGTAPGGFLNASGDIRNTDPLLAALGNNGGTTLTHALLAGSAAINAGHTASAPKQDQRGWLRNGASDIGAFEFNGIDLRIISITRSASNIIITFTGVAGRTFRLERRLNVSGSSWQPVSGVADLTPSATGNAQFTDPNALDFGKAFYRVSLIQ